MSVSHAVAGADVEHVRVAFLRLVSQLLQRRDVVEDVDAAAVRSDDEIVVTRVDEDVIDTDRRQAVHEPLPLLAAVQRDVERVLGAEVEEVAVLRILPDHVDVAFREVARDRRPGLAEILRDEDVRLVIVGAVAVERDVTRARVEVGRLDPRDVRFLRHALALSTTFFHVAPPSRLTCRLPSLVPTHSTPGIR